MQWLGNRVICNVWSWVICKLYDNVLVIVCLSAGPAAWEGSGEDSVSEAWNLVFVL